MNWMDASEIVLGLILDGKQSLLSVQPEFFSEPYNQIVKTMKVTPEWEMKNLLAVDVVAVQNALNASHALNGLGESKDWINLLKEQRSKMEVAGAFEQAANRLKRGKEVDATILRGEIEKLTDNRVSMMRLSEVEDKPMQMLKVGWKALDDHFGGIPEVGLTTVLAPTKMGKTSFFIRLLGCFTKQYPDKNVAVFSVEMLETQFKARVRDIWPEVKNDDLRRIFINHDVSNVHDLCARAAAIEDIGLIGVDFADLLITGEVDSSKMEEIFRVLARLSTRLGVPIVLITQTNDVWQGGVPRPNHIRWTRMAEALSFAMIALWNPAKDYKAQDDKLNLGLSVIPGKAYIVCWLCRSETVHELPGAIETAWTDKDGWSLKSVGKWRELEMGAGKSSGKKKKSVVVINPEDDDDDWSIYNA